MMNLTLNIIIVYRPPPNTKYNFTVQQFYDEFINVLEQKAISPHKLMIVGDFNFHFESQDNTMATKFKDLLQTFDLT